MLGEGVLSTRGEAYEDASSSSMLGEGALSMLGEDAQSTPSKEGGIATSTSECLDMGEGLGMIGDEGDDWFGLV